jgi:hypothetical protein
MVRLLDPSADLLAPHHDAGDVRHRAMLAGPGPTGRIAGDSTSSPCTTASPACTTAPNARAHQGLPRRGRWRRKAGDQQPNFADHAFARRHAPCRSAHRALGNATCVLQQQRALDLDLDRHETFQGIAGGHGDRRPPTETVPSPSPASRRTRSSKASNP